METQANLENFKAALENYFGPYADRKYGVHDQKDIADELSMSTAQLSKLLGSHEKNGKDAYRHAINRVLQLKERKSLINENEQLKAEIAKERLNNNSNRKKNGPFTAKPDTRSMIFLIVILAAAITAIFLRDLFTAKAPELKMIVKVHPKSFVLDELNKMRELLFELSDGRINIASPEVTEKVGYDIEEFNDYPNYSIFYNVPYYEDNEGLKESIFLSAIPFGLNNKEMDLWFYQEGEEIWNTLDSKSKSFPLGNTGQQLGGWFFKEMKDTLSYNDLKMRIFGLGGWVLNKSFEKFQLERKILFPTKEMFIAKNINNPSSSYAIEYINAFTDDLASYADAGKDTSIGKLRLYLDGWQEPNTTFALSIKRKDWSKLSNNDQKLFELVVKAYHTKISAKYELEGLKKLNEWASSDKLSFEIDTFNLELLKELKKRTLTQLSSFEERSKFKKIYQSYKDFYKLMRGKEFTDTSHIPSLRPPIPFKLKAKAK